MSHPALVDARQLAGSVDSAFTAHNEPRSAGFLYRRSRIGSPAGPACARNVELFSPLRMVPCTVRPMSMPENP